MTSVTLPSTSGPIHQVYSSVSEEITNNSESDFESNLPTKRCLSTPTPYSNCKKRRKQATPIRISSTDWDGSEGKQSPEPELLHCTVCQQNFDQPDHLQNHIATAHSSSEVKKEPQHQFHDSYVGLRDFKFPRQELHLINEIQTKDWMVRNLNSSILMHMQQFPQSEGMQRQPIKIFNPDAFCDLCNKEFCNKYFLKTHKANKHGIYSETTSETTYPNTLQSYVRLPTTVPSEQLKTELQNSSNMLNPISDMFPSPFLNKLPRISQLNKSNPDEKDSNDNLQNSNASSNSGSEKIEATPNGESSSPRIIENESTSYKSDQESSQFVQSSNMSPGQIGFNKEVVDVSSRLRKIGVMNPKAFCEICCKEYCNKYFLRTHKMKRHGIVIPDERENKADAQPMFHWNQSNVQTSPLNLIKTEQINSDRKTTSPSDISCEICEIKFQNVGLAQIHNISVHSKLFTKESTENNDLNSEEPNKIQDALEKSSSNENINEDLKKLQTMILQLNELKVEKISLSCNACNKEFESRYFLHAHMITEHGLILDDIADMERSVEPDNSSSNNNTMCDLCGKDVESIDHLKKHIFECHSNLEPGTIKEEFSSEKTSRMSTSGMQFSERRMSVSLTPTSSYCEICNKELCNKYFMKTHMQRMHGIEIENGAQIGGVVCDICNKELCSKYFLRVHKHNTHGIVEYGASLLQPKKIDGEVTTSSTSDESSLRPGDLADLSHRYFTHFTEVCKICSRRFRSTKWLKAHLLNDHGQAGAEKWAEMEHQLSQNTAQHSRSQIKTESPTLKIPNSDLSATKLGLHNVLSLFGIDDTGSKIYQCSMCTFTTTLLPLMFVHERSHTQETGRMEFKCTVCGQIFHQNEHLQHHVFKQHPLFPMHTAANGAESRETCQTPEEESKKTMEETDAYKYLKQKKKKKWRKLELTADLEQTLNDVSKIAQMPVTYALPKFQNEDEDSKFTMQAFFMEEEAVDRHVVPAVVFLPVLQKQPAPFSVTFTLTPA